jgi:hypothetical protein
MNKEATLKCQWLRSKTSDKKEATSKRKGLKSKTFDKKEATLKRKGLKSKTSDEKRGNPEMQGAQIKDLRRKKMQPRNARGSNQRPPMKKEATLKRKGLKSKTSDGKRGNPETQGAHFLNLKQRSRTVSSPKIASPN